MFQIRIEAFVGDDGLLELRIPIGPNYAGKTVQVTIEPVLNSDTGSDDRSEWHRFVEETYGSCAGLGLERPEQLPLEERDPIE